jgi:hypothetical protein
MDEDEVGIRSLWDKVKVRRGWAFSVFAANQLDCSLPNQPLAMSLSPIPLVHKNIKHG